MDPFVDWRIWFSPEDSLWKLHQINAPGAGIVSVRKLDIINVSIHAEGKVMHAKGELTTEQEKMGVTATGDVLLPWARLQPKAQRVEVYECITAVGEVRT